MPTKAKGSLSLLLGTKSSFLGYDRVLQPYSLCWTNLVLSEFVILTNIGSTAFGSSFFLNTLVLIFWVDSPTQQQERTNRGFRLFLSRILENNKANQ